VRGGFWRVRGSKRGRHVFVLDVAGLLTGLKSQRVDVPGEGDL